MEDVTLNNPSFGEEVPMQSLDERDLSFLVKLSVLERFLVIKMKRSCCFHMSDWHEASDIIVA
ncbi:hypothetical protein CsSME_00023203 [Camellia sinensis var. sinensis]